ncbi:MerR family transcriptional regulator [Bacillus sp. FSL L8-0152]|uniref:MerR family transcriptional regulator n=1 Tax=Bacillus sp. FSL L8-0152 TaxID=2921516 RepID=UPI0030F62022
MIDKQLSDAYYRVSEVATMLDIPESTLRRWLNDFDEYLNIKKERQLKYVHEDSIDTVKKIKHYYSESKKKHEIVGFLDMDPTVIRNVYAEDVDSDGEPKETSLVKAQQVNLDFIEVLTEKITKEVTAKVTEELTKQNMEFFTAVAKQSQDNFDRINKRLEERDEKLMRTIRLIQEQKSANAQRQENTEQKGGFFSKLFGKK